MMLVARRSLVLVVAVVVILALASWWAGFRNAGGPSSTTPVADRPRSNQEDAPEPARTSGAAAAEENSIAPPAVLTTEDRGVAGSFEIALDEAVVRNADGKDTVVRLDPPATLETLAARLRDVSPEGKAWPVCYEPGRPRTDAFRRIITPDITVQLPSAETEPELPAGISLKERPSYAPGFAVVSAADPLAALAALPALRANAQVVSADIQLAAQLHRRALPNDPLVGDEWHIKYQGQFGAVAGSDVNVEGAWNYGGSGGVKGTGVRIGIVDDGMQHSHPDLAANADTDNDYDWNGFDGDPSPGSSNDRHGTACAGNAAARGNNNLGVTGTAPEATLVGMRLISAATTDSQEAGAMSHRSDIIQVKSNSWGPYDSGDILGGPGTMARAAIANSVATGRGGKGTVYLWAAGNGLRNNDNSNKDGWANDINVIAVSASDSQAGQAWYSEPGANILLCAPSSGDFLGVTTTDLVGSAGYSSTDYTEEFGGTSSATPTVAGIVALMLEKNPNLGYRDVQEILMRTAVTNSPFDFDWRTNGAGFDFNHKFGAGRVDATAAVNLAASWVNLAPSTIQTVSQSGLNVPIPDSNATGISRTFSFNGPPLRVEHAVVTFTAQHPYRGDLRVVLVSPSGMESVLINSHDDWNSNYSSWRFSTVRHWGEQSTGNWTLRVSDLVPGDSGTLASVSLSLQGSLGTGVNPGPAVQITSPAPGAGFSPGATVQVAVTASDLTSTGAPGTVTSVELLDNGVSRGIDTTAPYEFSFQPPLGFHDLVAVAIDSDGAEATSAPVTISVANQPPVVSGATLTTSQQAFADQPVAVTGATSSDAEGDPVTLAYEWQKSADDDTWTSAGGTSDTLAPSPENAGFLWRCRITPSDATQAGTPFVTSTVNLLVRPPLSALINQPFSYDSGLVLRGADSTVNRQAILNEFSQGSGSGEGEWVEILVLRTGALRNWRLSDAAGVQLVFKDDAVWDAIPAGTLIVIYNGTTKDPLLPADDSSAADAKLVLSSTNPAFFTGTWPVFTNSGDAVVLRNPENTLVAGFSYGTTTAIPPRIGNVDTGAAAFYIGGSDSGASAVSGWKTTTSTSTRSIGTRALGDLFISEYIEGSQNTKFLEIYNPTSATVDLAAHEYSVQIFLNGNTTGATPIDLIGTVAPGKVHVIRHGSATPPPNIVTQNAGTALNFTGDDAVVLKKGGVVVDSIGQIGVDPGNAWVGGAVSTLDKTLVRKPGVHTGDTNPNDTFDPSVEWNAFQNNTTGGLGAHTINPFLSLKATPATFVENAGPMASVGTVTLSTAAPAGGVSVVLASLDTSAANVPSFVTVPAGQTSANFNIAAVNDSNSDGTQITQITATANGYTSGSTEIIVTDDEPLLIGVTPAAGNTQANTTYVQNLSTGVYEGNSVFRFGATSNTPAGLEIDVASGLVSGTPTGPTGNHSIVIERFNILGDTVKQSFTLAITDSLPGYPGWIAGYPGLSGTGEADDPDFDGLANLVEYHLGANPGAADAAAVLPVLARSGDDLTLTWWRSKTATGTTGTAQWSDSLGSWSSSGIVTAVIADEPTREQVQATLTGGAGDDMKFLRLNVE